MRRQVVNATGIHRYLRQHHDLHIGAAGLDAIEDHVQALLDRIARQIRSSSRRGASPRVSRRDVDRGAAGV